MESRSSCNYCDRTFAHRSSLSRHLRDNHADRGDHKSIECNTCSARYVNNYAVCMSCDVLGGCKASWVNKHLCQRNVAV